MIHEEIIELKETQALASRSRKSFSQGFMTSIFKQLHLEFTQLLYNVMQIVFCSV